MIVSLETLPLTRWPNLRRTRNGGMIVVGRCLGTLRWKLMRIVGRWLCRIAGLFVLASAFLLPAMTEYESGPSSKWGNTIVRQMLWLRITTRDLLVSDFPDVGAFIAYDGRNPYDWHLGGAGFLLLVLAGPAGTVLGLILCGVLWPIIARKTKLTFTPEKVVLHQWWGRATFHRDDQDNPVSFRSVDLADVQPFVASAGTDRNFAGQPTRLGTKAAMLMQGLRQHLIARPLRPQRAEQIVVACHIAMKETRSLTPSGDRR